MEVVLEQLVLFAIKDLSHPLTALPASLMLELVVKTSLENALLAEFSTGQLIMLSELVSNANTIRQS